MKREKTNSIIDMSSQIFHLWHGLEDPCGVKDLNSRFIYVNRAYYAMNGLPDKYDITGKFNDEVPAPVAAVAEQLRAHDRLAINSRQRKTSLEIHEFGYERRYQAYLVDKMPFYDAAGNIIGSWFHAKKAMTVSADIFSDKKQKAGEILLYNPANVFTDNEWLVVFLLMRHFSQREIAGILSRSVSRINSIVTDIYNKSGVSNATHLRDFIRHNGWQSFVPERFALHGHFLLK